MQIGVDGARIIVRRSDHGVMTGVGIEIGSYRNARALPRWINKLVNWFG